MKKRAAELSLHSNIAMKAMLSLMAMLFLLLIVIVTLHNDRLLKEEKELGILAARASGKVDRLLAASVARIEAAAFLIGPDGSVAASFEAYADTLIRDKVARGVFLAPGGIVERIHPSGDGREEIGRDCNSPDDPCSQKAIATGRPSIAGPVGDMTGEQSLSGRLPVYRDEGLWGIIGAELDFAAVLDPLLLDDPAGTGFCYRLWSAPNGDGERSLLWASSGRATKPVGTERIAGFGLGWHIEVSRKHNIDEAVRNWLYLAGLILVCLLVAALAFHYWKLRDIKAILESQAMTDNLTGLPNRRSVMATLDGMIAEARRTGEPFVVLYMDLNNFKKVNDLHGHESGDDVLRGIAAILRDNVRDIGHIGRIGGDEFVVLLDRMGEGGRLDRIIEVLSKRLRMTVGAIGGEVEVSVSVGAASYPDNGDDSASLLHAADLDMYEAKRRLKGTRRTGPFRKNFR